MNALVAKEIRQLRPAFVAAVLLAAVPVWLCHSDWKENYFVNQVFNKVSFFFCFGWLLLALTTFGREFGMGTFPVLLALPVTRQRIWWTKIAVLLCAMAIVLGVGATSGRLWYLAMSDHLIWDNPADNNFDHAVPTVILTFVVIAASGLWTTLFLRQMLAAFWFAIVVPLALLMLASWGGDNVLAGEIVLGIYAVAGLLLAQRLFYRAQEVAWTGGEVNLPTLRSAGAASTDAGRSYHPLRALIGKELQLYKIPMAGMAAMFVLHLGVVLLRRSLVNTGTNPTLLMVLSEFGALWLLVPLVTASIGVSEERRMGTMEAQLCQPVSQRAQFAVKLIVALLITGLLCGSLAWKAEHISAALDAGNGFLGGKSLADIDSWQNTLPVFLFISFVVFFVSTLARNLLQAIAFALALGIGIFFWPGDNGVRGSGWFGFLNGPLLKLLLWPPLLVVTLRLAYTNFRRLSEPWRAWLRTVRALGATILIVVALTALLFFRTWDYLTPLEPPHGPAKITLVSAPQLRFGWDSVSVFMPEGWLWSERIAFEVPKKIDLLGSNQPISLGAGRWVRTPVNDPETGSNWIAQACDSYERVAIRSDGTLWVSKEPVRAFHHKDVHLVANKPAPMVRIGDGANWKDVVWLSAGESAALLKNDGTLWTLLLEFSKAKGGFCGGPPIQLGTNSHWSHLIETSPGVTACKNDGSTWAITKADRSPAEASAGVPPKFTATAIRDPYHLRLRSYARSNWRWLGVRDDGTLWTANLKLGGKNNDEVIELPDSQVGTETNWVSVAGNYWSFIALKNDGTLWKWNTEDAQFLRGSLTPQPLSQWPARLGTHSDWVALDRNGPGICSLAADGGVWLWTHEFEDYVWLTASRKPVELGNVYSQ